MDEKSIACSIAPWLSVPHGVQAIEFYRSAFSADETYRLDVPGGGLVARLSVAGAEFWVSAEPADEAQPSTARLGCEAIRMILTVPDPDAVFLQAIAAGATEVAPIGDRHGWRIGRIVDPFGHQWEIGRPLSAPQ